MRSFFLAALATFAIPACAEDITGGGAPGGGGGGDDQQQQPTCGNGVVDNGEACDDGNTNNGDGCSSTCRTENTAAPRVAIAVDKPTLTPMDLGQSASVAVTLTSMMGFTGDVTLAATVVDSTQAPITDWITHLDSTTVTVAANGTATAHVAISAMGNTGKVAGKVKITASSGSVSADASIDVTFNPVFRVTYTNNGNNCVYPTDGTVANPYLVKAGYKLAVFNGGNGLAFVIHGPQAPGADGFQHENTGGTGTPAGAAYMSNTLTTTDTANAINFYCHSGTANTLSGATTGNYFKVVP